MTGIERAVKMAGGQAELAARLDPAVTQQAISKWVARGWVPIDRAVEIGLLFDIPIGELASATLVKALS